MQISALTCGLMASAALLLGCNNNAMQDQEAKVNTPLKEIAIKAQDAFFKDYDEVGVKRYFRQDYIQHNPHVPTGIEPVLAFLPALKAAGTQYQNHRLLQDGDFIIMHNTYTNAQAFGAEHVVTFDVWRMQDGQVAEHWDAIAPVVQQTASGRSQFDGPTLVQDRDKTEENKRLVTRFVEDVLFGNAPENITQYISSTNYHQHNTAIKDGLDGLNEALAALATQNNLFEYHKIHRVWGEGNFVLVQSEGRWNEKPQAFYDLFRVESGQLVEHWDIIQEIPEQMAHGNGMF